LSRRLNVTPINEDVRLQIGGSVVADVLFNQRRPVANGTPFFLTPGSPAGFNQNSFDAHARQSSLVVKAFGPTIGTDWETFANVYLNFYESSIIDDRYGVLPLEAYGDVHNSDWRFSAGLQHDIFAAIDPTMLAYSWLYGAGNSGGYRLNVSGTRFLRLTESSQVDVTIGISDPTSTTINNVTLVEDNGLPNLESRIKYSHGTVSGHAGSMSLPVELGLSTVIGQLRSTDLYHGRRTVANVWGVAADFKVPLSARFGAMGEIYIGQSLGQYNGGVFQSLGPNGLRVRSMGGWGEVYYFLVPDKLHTHVGYGIDDPNDNDLGADAILRNDAFYSNLIWDVNQTIRIGCELTHRSTSYNTVPDNRGFGVMTQFVWRF
jgi:hypothetical protein